METSVPQSTRMYLLVLCLLLVGAIQGCTTEQVPPDGVARQFVNAVVSGDASSASALSGQAISESDLTVLRKAWTGSEATGEVDSVSFASVGIEDGTVTYDITELDLADVEDVALDSADTVRAVYLAQEGTTWVVVFAE